MLDDDADSVSIILTKVIDYEKSEDWMKHSHPWVGCRGRSNFRYSLYIHDLGEELHPIVRLAKEKAFKLDVEAKIGSATQETIPCDLSVLDIQCDSAMISAFYRYGGRFILRLYESKGNNSRIKIKSFLKLDSIEAVDFFGSPIERNQIVVSDDGYTFQTDLIPWEIINLAFNVN